MRNSETTGLRYKHLKFTCEVWTGGVPYDPPYFTVNLKNQKNWQRKMDETEHLQGKETCLSFRDGQ